MKKGKLLTSIFILILLIGIATIVRAESMEYDVSPKVETLKEGEEIEIAIDVSDLDMGENGIYTFGGKLEYDQNIFEKVTTENFTMANDWTVLFNDEETEKEGNFLATNKVGIKQEQKIGTLKLKVKTNLKSEKTEVKFIKVSSVGEETYNLKDSIVTLSIEGTIEDKKPEEPIQQQIPAIQKDTTISNIIIPKAGKGSTIIIGITLFIGIVAAVSYIQVKKNKNI